MQLWKELSAMHGACFENAYLQKFSLACKTAYPTNGDGRQAIRIFDTSLLTSVCLVIGQFLIMLTTNRISMDSLRISGPARSWFGDDVFLEENKLIAALLIGLLVPLPHLTRSVLRSQ